MKKIIRKRITILFIMATIVAVMAIVKKSEVEDLYATSLDLAIAEVTNIPFEKIVEYKNEKKMLNTNDLLDHFGYEQEIINNQVTDFPVIVESGRHYYVAVSRNDEGFVTDKETIPYDECYNIRSIHRKVIKVIE